MTANVYTTDQLRVLARLCAVPVPPSLGPQWMDSDELVADVVATRTLLAMGALALVPGQASLRPTAAVEAALCPARDADTVMEASHTSPDGTTQRQVLAGHPGAGLRLREREPDVWVLEPGASATALLDEVLGGLADGVAPEGAGRVVVAHRLREERFAVDEVSWRSDAAGWWLSVPAGAVDGVDETVERPSNAVEVGEALRALANLRAR